MCNIFQIQLKLGFLIATFGLVVSCLITNCPKGGKRSEGAVGPQVNTYPEGNSVYCSPCGPGNEGVCISKGLCCGKGMGCHSSQSYTKQCQNVNSFRSSCLWDLVMPTCGDKGRCKSKYLCCSKDHCVFDMSCKSMPSVRYKEFAESLFNNHLLPSLPLMSTNKPSGINEEENWKMKYDWSYLSPDYES